MDDLETARQLAELIQSYGLIGGVAAAVWFIKDLQKKIEKLPEAVCEHLQEHPIPVEIRVSKRAD